MNTTTNGTTAAQVESIVKSVSESLMSCRPVSEEKTGRQCFAFALYIGRELSRFLTVGAWYTQEQAERVADGMALAALSFKKTASIAVYILQNNGVYKLHTTRQNHGFALNYIHKSRISGREYLAPTEEENRVICGRIDADCVRFVGASALPVGWNEPKQITVGDTVTHKKTGQRAKVTSKHTQYFKAFGGVRWVYRLNFGKSVTFAGAEMNGGEFLFEAIEKV
jgi:hypothetical protein